MTGGALRGLLLWSRALASAAYAAVLRGTRRVRAGVPTDRRPPFRVASERVKTGVNVID